jgi:activator of HSP90 ATPase
LTPSALLRGPHQPPLPLEVPLSGFTPRVGGGSAFRVSSTNPTMNTHSLTPAKSLTRRHAITDIALALGSIALGTKTFGQTATQTMAQMPSNAANQKRTSLHQEMALSANPTRIYKALLDAKQFEAFSGSTAEIDPKEGGHFSLFGGLIIGRNVELVSDQRIVQAWRPTHWNPGIYSIVKFELNPHDSETMLVLDHTGFPEGEFDHLSYGWKSHYYGSIKKFLT